MIARLTFFSVAKENVEELKRIYNEEIVPVIRSQKGSVGAWLLEPTDAKDDFISLTEWLSKADAEAYEVTGTYKEMLKKVKDKFKGDSVLKTYTTADNKIIATA